jgi:hypothetical protein
MSAGQARTGHDARPTTFEDTASSRKALREPSARRGNQVHLLYTYEYVISPRSADLESGWI